MADNFNLRAFLSENSLTKNAKLLKEEWQFYDVMNAIENWADPGTPEYAELEAAVDLAYHNNEIDTSEFSDDLSAPSREVGKIAKQLGLDEAKKETWEEGYSPKSKLEQVIQAAWAEKDLNKAKQLVIDLIEPSRINSKQQILDTLKSINNKGRLDQYLANSLLKFEKLGLSETEGELEEDNAVPEDSTDMAIDMMKNGLPRESVKENKMTPREKYLTKLVKEALDLEGHGDDNVLAKLEKRGDQPTQQAPTYSEGDEMAKETVIPEYRTIEELMGSIQKGTDKIAEEHKIQEMKKIADALRNKAKRMEESEHAQHINPKDLKQLAKDAAALEKAAEKLKAAFDKKFNKKEKAAAPKAEAEKPALQENTMENTFDLKKFLVENKLTTNSRLIKESIESDPGTITQAFQEAGVNLSVPTEIEMYYGHDKEVEAFATGQKALDYLEELRAEKEAEDPDFNTQSGVVYDYDGEDMEDLYEGERTPKLIINFGDSAMYIIAQ